MFVCVQFSEKGEAVENKYLARQISGKGSIFSTAIGIVLLCSGCGGGGGGSGSSGSGMTATANFYNGATLTPHILLAQNNDRTTPEKSTPLWGSGTWQFAPNTMTLTATGACLLAAGETHCATVSFANPCVVTYSQGKPTLASLASCTCLL